MSQDVTDIRKLEGDKRLLDWAQKKGYNFDILAKKLWIINANHLRIYTPYFI